MISSTVLNDSTNRYTKTNATQPSLWDAPVEFEPIALGIGPDEYAMRDLRFPWASGDTSNEAIQRMLAHVTGQKHYLIDCLFHKGHAVWLYADVLETWVDQGVVCGHCKVTVGGPYVEALRAGKAVENEEDE